MGKGFQVFPQANPMQQAIDLYMFVDNGNGTRDAVINMTMQRVEPGSYYEASTRLDFAAAQQLADSLWNLGFRPTQSKQADGAMGAQGAHLSDMRAIVFAKLSIEPPK